MGTRVDGVRETSLTFLFYVSLGDAPDGCKVRTKLADWLNTV